MLQNKKGVESLVSWVMLVALSVIIGFAVLQWSRTNVSVTVEDLVVKGDILTMCQETSLSVNTFCQKTQTLNMNLSNGGDRRIDGLMVSGFDIYDNPQSGQKNLTIEPGKSKSVEVVKQGILEKAEVMPFIFLDKKRVVCVSRKVGLEPIPFC